jgi:glycosyltransferase involved in cell wall biosynthesis
MSPTISVIMPVYNVERYARRAVDSVLGQSYRDFEFIVINDGSTDGTREILASYGDERLNIQDNARNLGYVLSLNRGLALARGKYIARMDGDDVSLPDRFASQVRFLNEHGDVGVCGSRVETIGHGGGVVWRPPCDHPDIVCNSLFESTLYHPTVMIRREVLEQSGLEYDNSYYGAEDFRLWVQLSRRTRLANLDVVLLYYNRHETQVSRKQSATQLDSANRVRGNQLSEFFGGVSETDRELHNLIGRRDQEGIRGRKREALRWLQKLKVLNQGTGAFPEPAFSQCLERKERWVRTHARSAWGRAVRRLAAIGSRVRRRVFQ